MTQVTYPLYASVQDNRGALINMIKRLTMTIAYITMPAMFILILIAKPLFVLLYSDRWLPSIPYFQVLCFAGIVSCLISVNGQPIAAIGKSKVMFSWTIIKRLVGLIAIIVGLLLFGMKGLLCGVVINTWFSYIVNAWLVSKYIGYKLTNQLMDLMPVTIVAVLAAVISYFVGYFSGFEMYLKGFLVLIVYLVVYMGWSLFFKPEAYTYTLSIIPSKFRFWEKKTNK